MKQFEKINLSADMYSKAREREMTFTQMLEEQDPSSQYEGTTLDAFERQLAVRGIKTRGSRSASLEVMYDPSNRVLFPELINRNVREGMFLGRNNVNLADIVATESFIKGDVVKAVNFDEAVLANSKTSRRRVGEGGKFPRVTISTGDATIQARKYGRELNITYEARRRMSIDMFTLGVRQIALTWSQGMITEAIAALLDGANDMNTATSGTLEFRDILALSIAMSPYEGGIMIGDATGCEDLLTESSFRDSQLTDFNKTGMWPTVLGANVKLNDASGLANKILCIDPRFALEQVTEEGSLIQEEEHVIDGQWDKVVISQVTGFSRIFDGAVNVLNTTWSG